MRHDASHEATQHIVHSKATKPAIQQCDVMCDETARACTKAVAQKQELDVENECNERAATDDDVHEQVRDHDDWTDHVSEMTPVQDSTTHNDVDREREREGERERERGREEIR